MYCTVVLIKSRVYVVVLEIEIEIVVVVIIAILGLNLLTRWLFRGCSPSAAECPHVHGDYVRL